jgi:hypothetical protein
MDGAPAGRLRAGGTATECRTVELADRRTHDLDVVLMWSRASGDVWVNVTHWRSGRTARIDATPTNALDVFEHPLAYVRCAA